MPGRQEEKKHSKGACCALYVGLYASKGKAVV